jgi:two-component sensor histidine kinase
MPISRRAGTRRPKNRLMTFDDSLWKLVGSAESAEPTDASKKDEYVADAVIPQEEGEAVMATVQRPVVVRLAAVRKLFQQPASAHELERRREALRSSDRFITKMAAITEDVKDWIRQERGDRMGG